MHDVQRLIQDSLKSVDLKKIILSNSKGVVTRAELRPIMIKNKRTIQLSEQKNTQIFHKNISLEEASAYVLSNLDSTFREAHLFIGDDDLHIWRKKNGQFVTNIAQTNVKVEKEHNRQKNYFLEEGVPYPFFVALKVMDSQGKVYASQRDKFRQVNRFLEIACDAILQLDPSQNVKIIDLGCGKAYLTFALYHYLHEILGLNIEMVGVDRKEDVIRSLNQISKECGYHSLKFQPGSIENFATEGTIDVMVALHACNTATDYAIAKAVSLHAQILLVAPCCQQELFKQVQSSLLEPLLKYGLLKERFSALATDACRALILNLVNYKTQILEFVDPQHTPKNLLIRATRASGPLQNRQKLLEEYETFKKTLHITPILEQLVKL